MIIEFKNIYLQKLFEGKTLPGKPKYSNEVISKFKKTVLLMQFADNIREIRKFKGLNFEALKGKMKGYYSVRVDYQYRLILTVDEQKNILVGEVLSIHELTNHYQ